MRFMELAKARYSVRDYSGKAVEPEKPAAILEAGRIAPTACNNQPQKVYVAKSADALERLRAVCPCAFNAPTVLVVAYDNDRDWKNARMPGYHSGETDAAIVCTHMMLEAWEQGIASCWVGWFNAEEVRAALGLSENITVSALLPIGYAAEGAAPHANHTKYRPAEDTIAEL